MDDSPDAAIGHFHVLVECMPVLDDYLCSRCGALKNTVFMCAEARCSYAICEECKDAGR